MINISLLLLLSFSNGVDFLYKQFQYHPCVDPEFKSTHARFCKMHFGYVYNSYKPSPPKPEDIKRNPDCYFNYIGSQILPDSFMHECCIYRPTNRSMSRAIEDLSSEDGIIDTVTEMLLKEYCFFNDPLKNARPVMIDHHALDGFRIDPTPTEYDQSKYALTIYVEYPVSLFMKAYAMQYMHHIDHMYDLGYNQAHFDFELVRRIENLEFLLIEAMPSGDLRKKALHARDLYISKANLTENFTSDRLAFDDKYKKVLAFIDTLTKSTTTQLSLDHNVPEGIVTAFLKEREAKNQKYIFDYGLFLFPYKPVNYGLYYYDRESLDTELCKTMDCETIIGRKLTYTAEDDQVLLYRLALKMDPSFKINTQYAYPSTVRLLQQERPGEDIFSDDYVIVRKDNQLANTKMNHPHPVDVKTNSGVAANLPYAINHPTDPRKNPKKLEPLKDTKKHVEPKKAHKKHTEPQKDSTQQDGVTKMGKGESTDDSSEEKTGFFEHPFAVSLFGMCTILGLIGIRVWYKKHYKHNYAAKVNSNANAPVLSMPSLSDASFGSALTSMIDNKLAMSNERYVSPSPSYVM